MPDIRRIAVRAQQQNRGLNRRGESKHRCGDGIGEQAIDHIQDPECGFMRQFQS